MKRRTWTVALVILLGGLWRIAGAAEGPAAKPAVKPAAEPAPAPKVVYLEKCRGWGLMPAEMVHQGILAQELFRQALLIAARDELGLRTRDAWLGDAMPEGGGNPPLDIAAGPGQRTLIEYLRGFYPVQEIIARDWHESKGPLDYVALAVDREKASRTTLVAVLKQAGFEGKPNARKPDAKVPEKVQQLLGEMTFTSQFDAVRRLHAAIRADGESPARLGALARAYANLGILTEVYWHPAHKVFKARAMLYAQRLPAAEEEPSPGALWHRAYVLTLVGLHKQALAELETAEKAWKEAGEKDEKKRPGWVDLLGSFCRYDLQKLAPNQTTEANRELSWLLRFVATEQSGSFTQTVETALETLEAVPECYRVHDGLCEVGGVAVLHRATVAGLATLSQRLYPRLADMPGLPEDVQQIVKRGEGGGVLGALLGGGRRSLTDEFPKRRELMRALCKARPAGPTPEPGKDQDAAAEGPSRAAPDAGDPSWAALGHLVRELSFLQVMRRADFEAGPLSVPTDEFLDASAPLVADHRFRPFLETYREDDQAKKKARGELAKIEPEGLEFHALRISSPFLRTNEPVRIAYNTRMLVSDDPTARDYHLFHANVGGNRLVKARNLQGVSPHNPAARATLIRVDWKNVAGDAEKWERESAGHPAVLGALAAAYQKQGRTDDAVRCLKKVIEAAPDLASYHHLAKVYLNQGHEDQWLATLEEYLEQPDYGLGHARTRKAIAWHFMEKGELERALPYAEDAAASYAQWALLTAATCHKAMKHWDKAEQYYKAAALRYKDGNMRWFRFCKVTGHGDLQAAREVALEHVEKVKARGPEADRSDVGLFHLLDGEPDKALPYYEEAFARNNNPFFGLMAALLADRLGQSEKRDRLLRETKTRGPKYLVYGKPRQQMLAVAGLMADDLAAGAKGQIDLPAAEKLIATAHPTEQVKLNYFLGKYLDLRSKPEAAVKLWKRSMSDINNLDVFARSLAGCELRAHGVKPDDFYEETFPRKPPQKSPASQDKPQ